MVVGPPVVGLRAVVRARMMQSPPVMLVEELDSLFDFRVDFLLSSQRSGNGTTKIWWPFPMALLI